MPNPLASLLGFVTGGGIKAITDPAMDLIETFVPNAEEDAKRIVAQDTQLMRQYTAEFRRLENRTLWDSFVDGLNRIIRPAMTIGFVGFVLVLPPISPPLFAEIVTSYELVPDFFWAIVMTIVAFYFGKRTIEKVQLKRMERDKIRGVIESVKRVRELAPERAPERVVSAVNQTAGFDEDGRRM